MGGDVHAVFHTGLSVASGGIYLRLRDIADHVSFGVTDGIALPKGNDAPGLGEQGGIQSAIGVLSHGFAVQTGDVNFSS